MTYFPYNEKLIESSGAKSDFDKFKNGNFGLWFNKYIPLKSVEEPKTSDNNGDDNKPVDYYKDRYKVDVNDSLEKKHLDQLAFYRSMGELGYKTIVFYAKLKTPLVTGIGESHPHEISMVFDHTLGIPYIPATGIKGVSRLSYILNHIFDEQGKLKDEFNKEKIDLKEIENFTDTFGFSERNDSKRGNVIFIDAFPLKTPELKVDVMTPHYGDYYSDDENKIPPADNQNPTPIKFLTVKEGTEFVFRALVKETDVEKTIKALKRALTEEGVGAKTALGYGMFEIIEEKEPAVMGKKYEEWLDNQLSPAEKERRKQKEDEEKLIKEKEEFLGKLKPDSDQGTRDHLFSQWQTKWNKDKDIAKKFLDTGLVNDKKVRDKKNKKGPKIYSSKYREIAEILDLPLDEH